MNCKTLTNVTRGTVLASNCYIANTFWSRLKGLLSKSSLPAGDALLITPCNSIHTFFMKFTIDVIFIDQNQVIVKAISGLKPWRLSGVAQRAVSAIELLEGTIDKSGTRLGDIVQL